MRAESGALHYKIGNVTLDTNVGGVGGFAKKLVSATLTDESVVKPLYTGTGDVYLEPSYGYYIILILNNEGEFKKFFWKLLKFRTEAVIDKGLYFASEGNIEVGMFTNKNLKTGFFGGEGFFQVNYHHSHISNIYEFLDQGKRNWMGCSFCCGSSR